MAVRGKWTLVTAPASEPMTLADAKAQCRVDGTAEDDLLSAYITAARQHVETVCSRALLTQTWDLYLDAWPVCPVIELPRPVLQSVTSVCYYDADDNENTLASSAYLVDLYSLPGRIVLKAGESWPNTTLRAANGVRVRFVSGWSAAADVPSTIVLALKLLVGHWYENREATAPGQPLPPAPWGVDALVYPWVCWY